MQRKRKVIGFAALIMGVVLLFGTLLGSAVTDFADNTIDSMDADGLGYSEHDEAFTDEEIDAMYEGVVVFTESERNDADSISYSLTLKKKIDDDSAVYTLSYDLGTVTSYDSTHTYSEVRDMHADYIIVDDLGESVLEGQFELYGSKNISKSTYTYDDKAKKPTVKAYDADGNLIEKSNHTVSYQNNTKVGKATVTVTFKGSYTGTVKKTFTINPKAVKLTKATAKKKAIALKWKTQTKQAAGCQIEYATNSKFTKNKEYVTVSGAKKSSKTITGLKANTTYYARIRTYKTCSNGMDHVTIYSKWSETQTVKTK